MWRLLDLGAIDGYTMTNLYEAVGKAVSAKQAPNTLILNHPSEPFVNVGYHQLIEKEINLEYAREKAFTLVRRTIGGGAILDGPWEQDYFMVVHRKSEECPITIPEFYQKFLLPPLHVLQSYGLEAKIRPPNDILVGDQKISGNGAIGIDEANVLAGDILLEAPVDLMAQIINAPSEKFQDKLAKTMSQWITSLQSLLSNPPSREEVKQRLIEAFKSQLGIEMEPGVLLAEEQATLEKLIEERRQKEWIFGKDLEYHELVASDPSQSTKIRGGIGVHEATHKSAKMVRVTMVSIENTIDRISISGDFFTQPYLGAISQLEEKLQGASLEQSALQQRITEAFESIGLRTLGASPEDFIEAILKAKKSGLME